MNDNMKQAMLGGLQAHFGTSFGRWPTGAAAIQPQEQPKQEYFSGGWDDQGAVATGYCQTEPAKQEADAPWPFNKGSAMAIGATQAWTNDAAKQTEDDFLRRMKDYLAQHGLTTVAIEAVEDGLEKEAPLVKMPEPCSEPKAGNDSPRGLTVMSALAGPRLGAACWQADT